MDARDLVTRGIQCSGVALLVAASLPFMAVALFVLRVALIGAALVGLASVLVLTCVYPPFRRWAIRVTRFPESSLHS